MTPNNLITTASFIPNSLQPPNAWVGHLPFAAWVIQEVSPKIFVELGTHSGNSYFSFCQSVVEAGISSKCYSVDTWQGDEHAGQYGDEIFAKVNAHHQERYAGFSRLLRMTFDDAVTYFSDESIDLLHIDGLHTYEAVRHDFETWLPKLAPGAVVIFHDTKVRDHNFGVWKLWGELQASYPNNLEFVHAHGLGVLQLNNAPQDKKLEWLQPDSSEKQRLKNYFAALGSRQLERYELNELKQHAASLNQAVVERDGQITDLDQAVVDRDRQIASLNQVVAERDGLVAQLQATVQTQQVLAHHREEQLTQLTAERERLAQDVARLQTTMERQEQTLQQQHETLVQIFGSLSWRLITDWRCLKDKLLPVGKRRRSGWDLIVKSVKVMRKEGFLVFWNRVNKRVHIPAVLAILVRKKYVPRLNPIHDIKPNIGGRGRWVSTGVDPQFLLEGPLPTGWVKISYQAPVKGGECSRLYFDFGSGFKEKNSLHVEFLSSKACPIFFFFEPGIRRIRLDPCEKEGEFELGGLSITRVSSVEVALDIFIGRFLYHCQHGTLIQTFRKVLQIVFSEDLTALRDKLRKHLPSFEMSDADRYKIWLDKHVQTNKNYYNTAQAIESFNYHPKFSIIVPVYNTERKWLSSCIASVLAQEYPYFELCLADDASTLGHVRRVLEEYKLRDDRVKVIYREKNGHISAATNSALESATGDYICLMDHDDEIPPNALFEFARLLSRDPDIDMIYSDEDKIDAMGRRYEPFFKPDWSPDYLESCMYSAHFACYRMRIVKELGGFREGCDGAQDYDFVLRFVELAKKIEHIPEILYHWRAIPGSTALEMSEKKYVLDAGVKALSDRVVRKGYRGTVRISPFPGCFNILYEIVRNPLISIIIPSAGKKSVIRGTNIDLLANCIESIVHKSTYRNYEIIIVDNNDLEKSTIRRISNHVKHFIHFKKPFNIASKMNLGAQYASGDYLLFLNDDTEVISPDWIEGLLGLAQQEPIGVVGPKLLFENGTLQHAGVSFIEGLPDHVFRSYPGNFPGHFFNVCGNRNYLAVTGACLMTKRIVFDKVNGFNEDFAVNYNDVDYCLKVCDAGYRIIYTPNAVLYHYESQCRERSVAPKEMGLFLDLWSEKTKRDPYYNPNLEERPPNFKIKIQ